MPTKSLKFFNFPRCTCLKFIWATKIIFPFVKANIQANLNQFNSVKNFMHRYQPKEKKNAPTDSSSYSSGAKCDVRRDLVVQRSWRGMETTFIQVIYGHSRLKLKIIFHSWGWDSHIHTCTYTCFSPTTSSFTSPFSPINKLIPKLGKLQLQEVFGSNWKY